MLTRRQWLGASRGWGLRTLAALATTQLPASWAQAPRILSGDIDPDVPLRWPRDHAAHLDSRVEWWSLKGELHPSQDQTLGFHVYFVRFQVESAANSRSRFAPRQVMAARASISDVDKREHWHDQRVARFGFGLADMAENQLSLALQDWQLTQPAEGASGLCHARIAARDFQLDLRCQAGQAPLLHGPDGILHRDPLLSYPTKYYAMVQLNVSGALTNRDGRRPVTGRAWLDHGWGRRMMSPDAVGSDWVCMNFNDGGALVVFRMRRSDGTPSISGAALRRPGKSDEVFHSEDVKMTPGDTWRSPASGARYPVSWRIDVGGHQFGVRARMPSQEVDGGSEIGDVFWEGLSDLLDAQDRVMGAGYLEMTGYAAEVAW